MDEQYVLPSLAVNKYKEAEKKRQTVFISGMCGYGKTTLVRHLLKDTAYSYFDMYSDPFSVLDCEVAKKTTVVIDNLSFLRDTSVCNKILELMGNPQAWCILISRAGCPEWLVSSALSLGGLVTISESDMNLSYEETKNLLAIHGVTNLNERALTRLYKYSLGHPLYLTYAASRIRLSSGSADISLSNDTILEEARQMLFSYFDHELLEKWSEDIIDFTVKMSIVTSFTIPLAVEITGFNNIEDIIEETNRLGSFLKYSNDIYSIVPPLRKYLNSKMYSLYSKEKIVNIYNIAGQYFLRHNKLLESYAMFEKSGNKSGQIDILIDNARLNPSDGYLTELKSAYLALDESIVLEHPELIAANCMIYSLLLDVEASDYWYNVLEGKAKALSGRAQKIAKSYLTYLDIACIHKSSKNVLPILKSMATAVFDKSITVPEWALTCNGPTIMNGGKDFCEWSKKDVEIYKALEIPFRRIFGKSSAGMPELSLAESFLEKGESDYEIMRLVSKGQMDADMRGRMELSFVAVGILSQLHLIHGHMDDGVNALLKFKSSLSNANPKLVKNIDTLLCRISLLTNDTEAIDIWLADAPDENIDFNVLYRYMYMCKIRCYLAKGDSDSAYTLLNKMMYYADVCERTFIKMECLILMAILEYRKGLPEWEKTFSEALALGEEYHFIRVFSRESAAILDMLNKCGYEYKDSSYKKQLFDEVSFLANMYPAYLGSQPSGKPEISENALEILKLQAQGLSNDEIAQTLFISKNTVKYHCKETYRKLGVNSRFAAITEAKKRGIL